MARRSPTLLAVALVLVAAGSCSSGTASGSNQTPSLSNVKHAFTSHGQKCETGALGAAVSRAGLIAAAQAAAKEQPGDSAARYLAAVQHLPDGSNYHVVTCGSSLLLEADEVVQEVVTQGMSPSLRTAVSATGVRIVTR